MKKTIIYAITLLFVAASCNKTKPAGENMNKENTTSADTAARQKGYSEVNGISMYYEIYGQGKPLVLVHGAGSTIQTTFGRVIPLLAQHRQLICVELQAHGRTGDRNQGISFRQDADDVAALLNNLNIPKADIFGFSNGGNTALQVAIRHPEICNKVIAGSVLLKRNGTFPQFWDMMKNADFEQMPQQYKDAFMQVNPDSARLMNMFNRCADRMNHFEDFPDQQISAIKSPVLFINGDQDVATPEHIVAMSRLIPGSRLAIIPGGHGAYIGEITTLKPGYTESDFVVPVINNFLDEPAVVK
jgi:pimeloyl-ACP methyl ester carboxylesterase